MAVAHQYRNNKEEHIHTHAYRVYDAAVATQVFKIAYKDKFKEYNRVDALLTLTAIILCCMLIEPFEIQHLFKLSIEII